MKFVCISVQTSKNSKIFFFCFQKIVNKLRDENTKSEVEQYTGETLEYLKSRENLWKNQTEKTGFNSDHIIDFSPENLARFYAQDSPLQL